jgi:succinate dehydrogenase / fumarate reductase flavoprotein subunit
VNRAAETYETHPHDVLVVGAGGAGLRAAIEAAEAGASVGLVCKSLLGKAHTVMAEGGVAAALANVAQEDSWQTHFRDTMVGGKLLNNWRMAQLHAQEAPARVRELERWGAVFDRTRDGRILQRPFGGHTHPRLAHVGDRTGLEMIRTLQDRAVQAGVTVYMECTTTHLLTDGDRVVGAFGYRRPTGDFVAFPAKAVILATGGIGRAYKITSNSWEYSGDGHALAYLAGAELIDMEFVQFHPTGMVWPPGVRGILVTEAVRGEGGILRNRDGERFMWSYLPDDRRSEYAETDEEASRWVQALSEGRQTDARQPPELSTRDNVSRAIYTEVREGRGTPNGGVYLDISHLPADLVRRKLPSMYEQFRELADVDITAGPMEVGPTVHYVMGGVRVDADTAASTRPGLFAAGEVAAGMHGANRLGGNSLSDLLVFGQRAGAAAAAFAAQAPPSADRDPQALRRMEAELMAPFDRPDGEDPYRLHAELQATMQSLVGIFRTAKELETAAKRLAELRARREKIRVVGSPGYNPGWDLSWELKSMLICSEAVARSALKRTETRGAHARIDYPDLDPEWGRRNTVVTWDGERMRVSAAPLPDLPDELRNLLAKKEGLPHG